MPRVVQYSQYYDKSVDNYMGDKIKLLNRINNFIDLKEKEIIPYIPFSVDKSSAYNDRGEVFRPYADNQVHHCHCGFRKNGDPLIAYRILPNGNILLICITDHNSMFKPSKRDVFVKNHKDVLPEDEIPTMRQIINLAK